MNPWVLAESGRISGPESIARLADREAAEDEAAGSDVDPMAEMREILSEASGRASWRRHQHAADRRVAAERR